MQKYSLSYTTICLMHLHCQRGWWGIFRVGSDKYWMKFLLLKRMETPQLQDGFREFLWIGIIAYLNLNYYSRGKDASCIMYWVTSCEECFFSELPRYRLTVGLRMGDQIVTAGRVFELKKYVSIWNINKILAGEHENRTHLTVLTHGDSGFEVRDGHQLRNLSLVFLLRIFPHT